MRVELFGQKIAYDKNGIGYMFRGMPLGFEFKTLRLIYLAKRVVNGQGLVAPIKDTTSIGDILLKIDGQK